MKIEIREVVNPSNDLISEVFIDGQFITSQTNNSWEAKKIADRITSALGKGKKC